MNGAETGRHAAPQVTALLSAETPTSLAGCPLLTVRLEGAGHQGKDMDFVHRRGGEGAEGSIRRTGRGEVEVRDIVGVVEVREPAEEKIALAINSQASHPQKAALPTCISTVVREPHLPDMGKLISAQMVLLRHEDAAHACTCILVIIINCSIPPMTVLQDPH